jgi:hypothetical protein
MLTAPSGRGAQAGNQRLGQDRIANPGRCDDEHTLAGAARGRGRPGFDVGAQAQ